MTTGSSACERWGRALAVLVVAGPLAGAGMRWAGIYLGHTLELLVSLAVGAALAWFLDYRLELQEHRQRLREAVEGAKAGMRSAQEPERRTGWGRPHENGNGAGGSKG